MRTAQRKVGRKLSEKGWGRVWERRKVPSSLPLSTLTFSRSLWLRAALHYLNAWSNLPLGNASLIVTQDGTKTMLAAQAKYKVLSTICYEVKYFSALVSFWMLYHRKQTLFTIERLRFTLTPNGKGEFVPRDQVFLSIVVNFLLLQLKNK